MARAAVDAIKDGAASRRRSAATRSWRGYDVAFTLIDDVIAAAWLPLAGWSYGDQRQ